MRNEAYYLNIIELLKVLGPVHRAAEALGRRDANLLTSEGIFEFLLNELKNLKTEISSKLLNALEVRIQETRKVELVTLFIYLQKPQNISTNKSNVFPLVSKLDIIKLSGKILSRIYPNSCMETDSDDEYIRDGETINHDNALKEAMEKSIHRFLEEPE
jgi:hypothetical protein